MNLLMLHPIHPSTGHISTARPWRFAQELTALGHHVVLITGVGGDEIRATPDPVTDDWQQPVVVSCTGAVGKVGTSLRLPRWFHRVRTALRMIKFGGDSATWVKAAIAAGSKLPPGFRPDVIWCIFSRMEGVFAARRIAHEWGCPWVLDVQDNWELFVPRGLRKLMAWRIRGFAAATANSNLTRNMTKRWQHTDARVIYSGIESFFVLQGERRLSNSFEINIVGSIYYPESLRGFLTGVAKWHRALPKDRRFRVLLRHIGAEGDLVWEIAHALVPALAVDLPGYVPATVMAEFCQQASVNAYIAHPHGFHHKLLELLACGRPTLAYPSEHAESIKLADPSAGQLIVPTTPTEVAECLTELSNAFFEHNTSRLRYPVARLSAYSWSMQAILLQQVLSSVTSTT